MRFLNVSRWIFFRKFTFKWTISSFGRPRKECLSNRAIRLKFMRSSFRLVAPSKESCCSLVREFQSRSNIVRFEAFRKDFARICWTCWPATYSFSRFLKAENSSGGIVEIVDDSISTFFINRFFKLSTVKLASSLTPIDLEWIMHSLLSLIWQLTVFWPNDSLNINDKINNEKIFIIFVSCIFWYNLIETVSKITREKWLSRFSLTSYHFYGISNGLSVENKSVFLFVFIDLHKMSIDWEFMLVGVRLEIVGFSIDILDSMKIFWGGKKEGILCLNLWKTPSRKLNNMALDFQMKNTGRFWIQWFTQFGHFLYF